jgi:hypothetical protein
MLYVVGVVVFAVLTILSTLRIIDPAVAASVNAAVTAVLGMFGVTVAGTAAYNINKQIHDGTVVEKKPDIGDLIEQALDRKLQQVGAPQVRDVPVLGPLALEVLDRIK